jgi:hypothetical protein
MKKSRKLSNKDIEEILILLEQRRRLKIVRNFLKNKYVWLPASSVLVYMIDNPDILIVHFLKNVVLKIFPFF